MAVCRKEDPFQALRVGSRLPLRNELSEEPQALTKGWRGGGQRKPGRLLCHVAWILRFPGDGISFQLSPANRCDPGSFLVAHTLPTQDGFQWGGFWDAGRTRGISFWPFRNSSGWQWLVSAVFLSRTSCHKITHGNGYYGAWPVWAVSVNVSPNSGVTVLVTSWSRAWRHRFSSELWVTCPDRSFEFLSSPAPVFRVSRKGHF